MTAENQLEFNDFIEKLNDVRDKSVSMTDSDSVLSKYLKWAVYGCFSKYTGGTILMDYENIATRSMEEWLEVAKIKDIEVMEFICNAVLKSSQQPAVMDVIRKVCDNVADELIYDAMKEKTTEFILELFVEMNIDVDMLVKVRSRWIIL